MSVRHPAFWSAFVTLFFAATTASAAPEDMGPFDVSIWDATGNPVGQKPPVETTVYFPTNACVPGAPVAMVHGAGESALYKAHVATLAASRGLVAVLPSFPSKLLSPKPSDGDTVDAMLKWAVAASADPTTPIAGKIDPAKWGVAGHSNGGVVFYAASSDPSIQVILGWDAVAGLTATGGFFGPSLFLESEGKQCGGGSPEGYDGAPAPKFMATVVGSSHCDFDDPMSPVCMPFCSAPAWNQTAATYIERYSIAWLVCLLGHDPSMQPYIDVMGEGLSGGESMGSVTCNDALPNCPPGAAGSGGAAGAAGSAGGADEAGASGADGDAGEAGASGAAGAAGASASGASGAAGAASQSGTPPSSSGGCGCEVGPSERAGEGLFLLGALAATLRGRRKRRAFTSSR